MKIAVLDDYQHVARASTDWTRLGPAVSVDFLHEPLGAAAAERLADYDILVAMRERTPFPAELLRRLPRLRLLVTTGMRNQAIDLAACEAQGVVVCGTAGDPQLAAEQAWALVLALYKQIPLNDAAIRRGAWQTDLGRTVRGQTLGLLGLGKLGQVVGGFGKAFGMRVIAWSPNLTAERCADAGVEYADKGAFFAQADVVSVHMVLSASTRHLIGAAELAAMKPTAFVVNTSRGPLIDEAALAAALQAGRLGGAGLDVFDAEPLPAHAAILQAPRTVLSPHVGYATQENYRTYFDHAVQDILAWRAGAPVRQLSA